MKSTPDADLNRIQNVENTDIQSSYAYILGMYLGDGYIVQNKRVYFLRITLDNDYPNIIQMCVDRVQKLLPGNKVRVLHSRQGDYSEVVCVYKFWPELFPQHGEGAKYSRKIELEGWQNAIIDCYPLEFFRGLYHSDGSRFRNVVNGKDYPRYQFSNSSADIRGLFCSTCDLLGLKWTINSGKKGICKDVLISKRRDVEYLDSVIGPKS